MICKKRGWLWSTALCDGVDDGFATVQEYFVFLAVALFFRCF